MLYLVLRFNIRLCESHNHSHTVDITLYYTVFPMPHVEEANKIIVIVIVIVIVASICLKDNRAIFQIPSKSKCSNSYGN